MVDALTLPLCPQLDTEIMNSGTSSFRLSACAGLAADPLGVCFLPEAHLSDHKRVALKGALSLKFGGLLELAEKATIVGELGKLLIEEIPLETTPPGYGRGPYHGACLSPSEASSAALN